MLTGMMQPLPHGYTNDTRGDGSVVVKRYTGPDADVRHATERDRLAELDGRLLAPRLLRSGPGFIEMQQLPGRHGQDLITAGHAAQVLRSCGETLRAVQAYAAPAVLVHGDFGPNNLLFDPGTRATTAVLDWEWSHHGDPVEDLAWCEWIVRMHHPDVTGCLDELFAGYGARPPWPQRRTAMLARCRQLLALPRPAGAPGADRWRRNLTVTAGWRPAG